MIEIINIHHKVPYDIYIGRGSKWGNPFTHLKSKIAKYKVATRENAINEYAKWIIGQQDLLSALPELKNKVLGCFCKPASCHGDILKELGEKECQND